MMKAAMAGTAVPLGVLMAGPCATRCLRQQIALRRVLVRCSDPSSILCVTIGRSLRVTMQQACHTSKQFDNMASLRASPVCQPTETCFSYALALALG
jgi:hypothetical protein